MKYQLISGWIGVILALALPGASRASSIVEPGWDLFETLPGTTFAGIPFAGVPLGSFDFGPPIGIRLTGSTDTIVQRKEVATVGDPTIPIEIVALELVSAAPVDLGAGLDFHYVTLQSARGGPASPGEMTIGGLDIEGDPHGTFDSFFDVFFDVRVGSLGGPIVFSGSDTLVGQAVPWSHIPPFGALEIPGVNALVNGADRDADFWPTVAFAERGNLAIHQVRPATPVSEPATLSLFGAGLGLFGLTRWKRSSISRTAELSEVAKASDP